MKRKVCEFCDNFGSNNNFKSITWYIGCPMFILKNNHQLANSFKGLACLKKIEHYIHLWSNKI
jgi:hypothetical protein